MEFTLSTLASATTGRSCLNASTVVEYIVTGTMRRSRRRFSQSTVPRVVKEERDKSKKQNASSFFHRDSLNVSKGNQRSVDESDDDTASTVTATSVDEDEEDTLSFGMCRRVSFATPVVTSIQYRPISTEDDKYYLYYNEIDYIDFKLEALTNGKSPLVRRSPRKVGFARDVVASTHAVMGMRERQQLKLYYNEEELQTFLDAFVESLQTQQTLR